MTFFLWLLLAVGLWLGIRGFFRLQNSQRFQHYWSLQSQWVKLFILSTAIITAIVAILILLLVPFAMLSVYPRSFVNVGLYIVWSIVALSAVIATVTVVQDMAA